MSDTKYSAVSQRFRALDRIKLASATPSSTEGAGAAGSVLPGMSSAAVLGTWMSDTLSDDDIDVVKGADNLSAPGDFLDGSLGAASDGKDSHPRGGYDGGSYGVDRPGAEGAAWNELGLDQLARDAK